jgi:major vault protein
MTNVVQIGRHEYIHVEDQNKVVIRLVCGPHTFIKQAHERVVRGCTPMINVKPNHYCKIQNPVVMKDGQPVEAFEGGQVKLRMGETEIRFHRSQPFPLYPGEKLVGSVTKMALIPKDTAYLVTALRDFTDVLSSGGTTERVAGEQWQVDGPKTYTERVETKVLGTIKGQVIKQGCALILTATRSLKDHEGKARHAGERWLVRTEGCYLPRLYEQILETVKGQVITHKTALQLRARANFTDIYGVERRAGQEWLVTNDMAVTHIVDVYEESVKTVYSTTLSNRQYCVIIGPYDDESGTNQYGRKEQRRGELTFFLKPGETLENGVQDIKVLSEDEALLLKAKEDCKDAEGDHTAGQSWLVKGPTEYIP